MPSTIKTTVVGSYPIPDWLKALPNQETMLDAVSVAMRAQESAGIDIICDGEVGRWNLIRNAPGGMVERFVEPMAGVQWRMTYQQKAAFLNRSDVAYRSVPPGVVTGRVGPGHLDLAHEWQQICGLTTSPLKFTVTSPYMLARVVADDYYHDLEKLTFAFADVLAAQVANIDAAILQIDDPNLPGTPKDSALAAAAINRVLNGASRATETGVHLCFGNYNGQQIQQGDYTHLIGFMNALQCDHLVLETTRRSPAELGRLQEIRSELRFSVGMIDVKDLQVESPDMVARRIEELGKAVGVERIQYVNPDCGLRVLPRIVADAKLRALVAGRNLFQGDTSFT